MKSILLLFCFFLSLSSFGSHIAGGVITYTPTGNLNEYEFTLRVYWECDAFLNTGSPVQLSFSNTCGHTGCTQFILSKIT